MAITILESLADKKPCGMRVKNASLAVMFELVRKHMGEIEEAVSRGYSWKQIDDACRESWQVQSDKAASIVWWTDGHMVQSCYYSEKKGIPLNKKTRKETPIALDVTITKR